MWLCCAFVFDYVLVVVLGRGCGKRRRIGVFQVAVRRGTEQRSECRAGYNRGTLNPIQKKRYEKRFSMIEASFRIEGMDPSQDAIYLNAKRQVLEGTLSPREAVSFVVAQSSRRSTQAYATA